MHFVDRHREKIHEHMLAGLRLDLFGVVEHPRDGRDRHLRLSRNLLDIQAPAPCPIVYL